MKILFHRALATIFLLAWLKFGTDIGIYLMNQPDDFSLFGGLALVVCCGIGIGFGLIRVYSSNFKTIKNLFKNKKTSL
jgi:hypothetical protein